MSNSDRIETYCMQRDLNGVLCHNRLSWEHFLKHGAVCDDCSKRDGKEKAEK